MLTHPYVKLSITIEDNSLQFLLTNNKPDIVCTNIQERELLG